MSIKLLNNLKDSNVEGNVFNISIGIALSLEWCLKEFNNLWLASQPKRTREHKLCPLPVASFIGQRRILDKMHYYFDLDIQSKHVFVLHGLGGSGKTQLALKFTEECQSNNRYERTELESTLT